MSYHTFQITEHPNRQTLTQTTASKLFLAILAAGPLVPPHYPLVEWSINVSRRDNPVTDFLFEFITVEKYQNSPGSDAATRAA